MCYPDNSWKTEATSPVNSSELARHALVSRMVSIARLERHTAVRAPYALHHVTKLLLWLRKRLTSPAC